MSDLVAAVLNPKFKKNSEMTINFINEQGADASGISRECLRIAVNELLTKSDIFNENSLLVNKETGSYSIN